MAEEPKVLFDQDGVQIVGKPGRPLVVEVDEISGTLYEHDSPLTFAAISALLARIAELEGERDRAREDAERQRGLVRRYREYEERAVALARSERAMVGRAVRHMLDAQGPPADGDTGKATTETRDD